MSPIEPASETSLLERLLAGEEAAFAEMIRVHGPGMRIGIRRLLRNDADVDEVLQEAFLSAFEGLSGFRREAALGTWLRRIATNRALMRLRGTRPDQEWPDHEWAGLLPSFVPCGAWAREEPPWNPALPASDGPEARAMHAELLGTVRACIDQLPEVARVALILRDLEEYTYEELAEVLTISPNAAKLRVHRARQFLKGLLTRADEGGCR